MQWLQLTQVSKGLNTLINPCDWLSHGQDCLEGIWAQSYESCWDKETMLGDVAETGHCQAITSHDKIR